MAHQASGLEGALCHHAPDMQLQHTSHGKSCASQGNKTSCASHGKSCASHGNIRAGPASWHLHPSEGWATATHTSQGKKSWQVMICNKLRHDDGDGDDDGDDGDGDDDDDEA